MDEFKPDWLALREAADVAARSSRLTRVVADTLPEDAELRVLDLATGTGANVRYLAEQLPPRQSWVLVDRDPVLLAELPPRMRSWSMARGLEVAGEDDTLLLSGSRLMCRLTAPPRPRDGRRERGCRYLAGRRFVTASALLDLVSERWLRTLAGRCRDSRAAMLRPLLRWPDPLFARRTGGRHRQGSRERASTGRQGIRRGAWATACGAPTSASPASVITCNASRAIGVSPKRANFRSS
jgi:hypothetical protein